MFAEKWLKKKLLWILLFLQLLLVLLIQGELVSFKADIFLLYETVSQPQTEKYL